jgi:hypothetical protein
MDSFNYIVTELLAREHVRDRLEAIQGAAIAPDSDERAGRKTLGARLVQLGLRLDPAAGEALRAADAPLTRQHGAQAR